LDQAGRARRERYNLVNPIGWGKLEREGTPILNGYASMELRFALVCCGVAIGEPDALANVPQQCAHTSP
jgi:hypothetical protein